MTADMAGEMKGEMKGEMTGRRLPCGNVLGLPTTVERWISLSGPEERMAT